MDMTSKKIKEAFSDAGLKVRVKEILKGKRFRVCTINLEAHTNLSLFVAQQLGLKDCFGNLGGDISQPHEMFVNYWG